jgi:cytochrome P450
MIIALTTLHRLDGFDKTATAIRTLPLHIITSPRVYATLRAEIDPAIAKNKISRPVISDAEARTLPYLQAVIKEGLWIFPLEKGLASKQVPPEGDTVNGMFLPGSAKIGANFWTLLRRTDVFGSDATTFRPERWLEAGPGQLLKMDRV